MPDPPARNAHHQALPEARAADRATRAQRAATAQRATSRRRQWLCAAGDWLGCMVTTGAGSVLWWAVWVLGRR
jgi:hypothetical protein